MGNVIELPNWDKKPSEFDCIFKHQDNFNHLTIKGFKKQNKTNLKLWLAVGLLLCVIGIQQYQIHHIAKSQHQVVVVDSQTDISGLEAVPMEEIK